MATALASMHAWRPHASGGQHRRLALPLGEGPPALRHRQGRHRQVDGCGRAGADAGRRRPQGPAGGSRRAPRHCAALRRAAAAVQGAQDRHRRARRQVNALAIDIEAAFLEYLDMFYNLGIAGRAMRRIGADRVRHDDRARPARRAAHRQDQGVGGPRRQEQAAGLRRRRGRLAADRPDRPVPRRHQGRLRSGQGRPGAFAERGRGQAAALRPDRDPPGDAAGGAADPGDGRGHRRAAGHSGCRSAA